MMFFSGEKITVSVIVTGLEESVFLSARKNHIKPLIHHIAVKNNDEYISGKVALLLEKVMLSVSRKQLTGIIMMTREEVTNTILEKVSWSKQANEIR